MGLASNSQTQNTSQQQQTNPWAPQAAALTQGFDSASAALHQAQSATGAPTDFVAQYTPEQLSAFQGMLGFGTGNGNIAGSSANAGSALTGSGANASAAGLTGLQGFNPSNIPSAVLSAASQYANNPQTQGMIDAATLDARRAVNEGTMPQIERNAALSGNINSNRTGIAQGIAERGLADTVANTSANIRGQQFNNGLNLAASQFGSNDSNRLAALGALTSGGNTAVGTGVGANSGAVAQQGGLYNIANQGVTGQQAGAQAPLNNAIQQWAFSQSSPFTALQNYMSAVGGQNWGSSSTGTATKDTTTTPSIMAQLGQGAGILSSFMGMPTGGGG
jgi:hypothetical protein